MKKRKEFLWVEKYRPVEIDDIILPLKIKNFAKEVIKREEIGNFIFNGKSGTGKTTLAIVLCEQLGIDYILINAGKDGNIDTLRTKVESFASQRSLTGKRRCVIFDEGDNLQPKTFVSLQPFIEKYSKTCSFIITTNFKEKLNSAIQSRFTIFDFVIYRSEKKELILSFIERVCSILKEENIKFNKKRIALFILECFPDMRKVLLSLQDGVVEGEIPVNISEISTTYSLDEIFDSIKNKDFNTLRTIIYEHGINVPEIIKSIDEVFNKKIDPSSIPYYVVKASEYEYRHNFAINKETNCLAFLCELVNNIKFKS